MYNRISPNEQARLGNNDVLSQIAALRAEIEQMKVSNLAAQHNAEITLDTGRQNVTFPYTSGGRLTLNTDFNPLPNEPTTSASAVYFVPFRGNQISIFDGSQWNSQTIPPGATGTALTLPLSVSQSGTLANGQPTVTGLADTSQIVVGMLVTSASGVPASTTVLSVDSASQITMSANATANVTQTVNCMYRCCSNINVFATDVGGGILALRGQIAYTPATLTVTNATNATPIVITTSANHNYNTYDIVNHENIGGNGNANGLYKITVLSATTYSLQNANDNSNVAGSGAYTSGGTARRATEAVGQNNPNTQDNIYVDSTGYMRYLGTVRINNQNNGLSTINGGSCYLWNYYNRIPRIISQTEQQGSTSWSYGTNAWRASNLDLQNRIDFVTGVTEDYYSFLFIQRVAAGASGAQTGCQVNIADVTQAPVFRATSTATAQTMLSSYASYTPTTNNGAGYIWIQALENGLGAAGTFFGGAGWQLFGTIYM